MENMQDLFSVVEQLRNKIDGKDREERFGGFMQKHGKKWKDDRSIGLRVFDELEERGVDVSAADEVLQKMLEGIREESIAQKRVIEDLLDKIEAVSDSVSKVLNEEQKVAETNTPMPPVDPNAMPPIIPPGGPGAPVPGADPTMGGLSADPAAAGGAPPAPPAPDPAAAGGAPPAPPAPDPAAAGGAPPAPDPNAMMSDINVKEDLGVTEESDDVLPNEGLDVSGEEEGGDDVEVTEQDIEAAIDRIVGSEPADEFDMNFEDDDEMIPMSSLESEETGLDDLFDEGEIDEDINEDDAVLNFLTKR